MKKAFLAILAAAIVLAVGVTGVFAASGKQGKNYTDADKDGVCDNCIACETVDEDGDGICDNCPNTGERPANGERERNRAGIGNGEGTGNGERPRNGEGIGSEKRAGQRNRQ